MSTKKKRKSMYSKCVVALVIILNVAFASVGLWINASGYDLSPTLTTCWFAFTGTELLALAGIQITKVRHTEPTYEESDTDNRDGVKGPKETTDEAPMDEEEWSEDADDSSETE